MSAQIWTKEDVELARPQGWELREFWCTDKRRLEFQIFKDDKSKIFITDEAARLYVAGRASADALAQKALRLMFNSKLGKKK